MKYAIPTVILAASGLLAACDASDPVELIGSSPTVSEGALQSGWEILPSDLESEHPLPNRTEQTHAVVAPEHALRFRIRFALINMEDGYDFLVIRNADGTEVARLTGRHRDYLSDVIEGNRATIDLTTDAYVRSHGFEVASLEFEGCLAEAPEAAPLEQVRTCQDLAARIRAYAVAEVEKRFNDSYGGPIRYMAERDSVEKGQDSTPNHSETNTQVEGVDEPDVVKTDGERIYAVSASELKIYQSWPADQTQILHRIPIEGHAKEMFLDGDRAIVLSGVQGDRSGFPPVQPFARVSWSPIWWNPEAFTKVTVIDVSGDMPTVESETLLAGIYHTARRMGESVRFVLQRRLQWPQITYYPHDVEWGTPEYEEARQNLREEALELVRNRPLLAWLPKSYRVVDGKRHRFLIHCNEFFLPEDGKLAGLMSVATLDLRPRRPSLHDTTLGVRAETVYQSRQSLYVTTGHQFACWQANAELGQFTHVHKLDVSVPYMSRYRASGVIEGRPDDQFALDEHRGYLRIAATNNRWRLPAEDRTTNRVYVMQQQGDILGVVGQVELEAPGERIMSSRFLGDRGFVVTFRQVDPLFTLDLSEPTHPTIVGELKIPGFSTYLHVLDQNHLFAIGNDFGEDGTTRNGVALSIFDVSDLAAPVLRHKAVVGTRRGHSESLFNHKSFTLFRPEVGDEVLLAIPFTDWTDDGSDNFWGTFKSTLKVFRASVNGILGVGELDHTALYADAGDMNWGWYYRPNIRRGVFVDDYVYAVSDAGVNVAAADDVATLVAEVQAPRNPLPTPISVSLSRSEMLAIPDAEPKGTASVLNVYEKMSIEYLEVSLDIEHTHVGDLVTIVEHNGVEAVLSENQGGSANNLQVTLETNLFAGEDASGDWTLRVIDTAHQDVGTLVEWKLFASGKTIVE